MIVIGTVAIDSNQPLYSNPFFLSQFGTIEVSWLRNGKLDGGGSRRPCPRSSNTAASVVAVAIESTGGVVGRDFERDD